MRRMPFGGLQTRIGLLLAAVLAVFIILTEVTISRLTHVAMTRQARTLHAGDVQESSQVFESVSQDLVKLRKAVLFYLIAGAVLVLLVSGFAIHRAVIRPLRRLNAALDRVAHGRLEAHIPIQGAVELREIGHAFNRMTQTIQANEQSLSRNLKEIEASNVELANAQDRLIRAAKLASVGTLAAGVAHEIGNPLAGILGLLEALERGDREHETEYISLMKQELERIDRIISKLLFYARMPQSEVPAISSVKSVLDAIGPLLKAQKVFDGVALVYEEIEDDRVGISKDDLMQILLNLALNSAEAMAGKGRVNIEAEPVDAWKSPGSLEIPALKIHVTDNGPGISDADASRIFDPFFTKKVNQQGTGLGLSICQNLCERVGGEIVFDTVYKGGTRFTVTLPRVL